jgi:CheY-like chemotaxis protein
MIINQSDFQHLRSWSRDEESFQSLLDFMVDATRNNGYLILHLDDDTVYLDAIGHYLNCGGFRVISLSSPQDALDCIKALNPALVIVDYYMPEMDGPTFYNKVVEQQISIPVVFLTSAADERTQKSQQETHTIFLSKTLPPDELVNKFSDLLGGSLL